MSTSASLDLSTPIGFPANPTCAATGLRRLGHKSKETNAADPGFWRPRAFEAERTAWSLIGSGRQGTYFSVRAIEIGYWTARTSTFRWSVLMAVRRRQGP